jgi:hypothetical protein
MVRPPKVMVDKERFPVVVEVALCVPLVELV